MTFFQSVIKNFAVNTMTRKIDAAIDPIQIPSTPSFVPKTRYAPTGTAISQYPTNVATEPKNWSPIPCSAPAATNWNYISSKNNRKAFHVDSNVLIIDRLSVYKAKISYLYDRNRMIEIVPKIIDDANAM